MCLTDETTVCNHINKNNIIMRREYVNVVFTASYPQIGNTDLIFIQVGRSLC